MWSKQMSDSVEVLRAGPAGSPVTEEESAGPATPAEKVLAQILAEVMRVEEVAADRHFFADLGADSLVMAHFCARVRKRPGLPPVSMKDVYRHPTIRSLATALGLGVCGVLCSGVFWFSVGTDAPP